MISRRSPTRWWAPGAAANQLAAVQKFRTDGSTPWNNTLTGPTTLAIATFSMVNGTITVSLAYVTAVRP